MQDVHTSLFTAYAFAGLICCVQSVAIRDESSSIGSPGQLEPVAVPMQFVATGENNGCYMVNVSIGTPAQQFRLTLDNSFSAIHVFSKFLKNKATSCKSTEIRRSLFDQSASKTFVLNGVTETEGGGPPDYRPYEDPRCAKDVFGLNAAGFNDTLQIGSLRRSSTAAMLITTVAAPLNPQWKADGWFGIQLLGWGATADTLDSLLRDFQRPQITLYYDRVEADDDKAGGILTLGGADSKNCDSRWVSPVNASSMYSTWRGWPLYLENFSIGSRRFAIQNYSAVVLKSSFITAPPTAIDAVVNAVGAEYDFQTDSYQVDCEKRASLPDMVFEVPNMQYRLPAVDYVRKLNVGDKRCTLMLKTDDAWSGANAWKLGTTFFRPYCMLVDYKAHTYMLAKAHH